MITETDLHSLSRTKRLGKPFGDGYINPKDSDGLNKKKGNEAVASFPFFMQNNAKLFHRIHYRFERFGMIESQVGEHFAIQLHLVGSELVHQPGISGAVQAGPGVDAGDPKAAVSALFKFAADISEGHGSVHCIFCNGENVFAAAKVALGSVENFFPPLARGYRID